MKMDTSKLIQGKPGKHRYLLVRDSASGHCCFEATLLDTSQPSDADWDEGKPVDYYYRAVAEFFDVDEGVSVTKLLNKVRP